MMSCTTPVSSQEISIQVLDGTGNRPYRGGIRYRLTIECAGRPDVNLAGLSASGMAVFGPKCPNGGAVLRYELQPSWMRCHPLAGSMAIDSRPSTVMVVLTALCDG